MSSLKQLQEELVEKDLIAEIDVEAITPIRIGGYRATPYSSGLKLPTKPSAKSLKGVWRWWARAAIVGAYGGSIDYRKANEHLNKVFGGVNEGTSLFRLEVSDMKYAQTQRREESYEKIPRVKLLLMREERKKEEMGEERKKEEMKALDTEGMTFKILLYKNRDLGEKPKEKVYFALSTLLLSLILGGIGSITRRGFGSLKINGFNFDHEGIDQEIEKIRNHLVSNNLNEATLKEDLLRLCKVAVDYAKDLFGEGKQTVGIPKVPSLGKIMIEVIECSSCDLVKIGRAFLKGSWKRTPTARHTWILGLPRCKMKGGKVESGYAVQKGGKYDPSRRISSIGARCFRAGNRNFIIVFGMLSGDWPSPNDLFHIGTRGVTSVSQISGRNLQNVFNEAWNKVAAILRGECRGDDGRDRHMHRRAK
ncbi:MAG: type III-B CRISPR module RAMP protein Cmr1 [Candidatus Korarchaeum sp.]